MHVGTIGRLCVAAAAAMLGTTAVATAAQPSAAFAQLHTKADTAAAQRASLTLADLGSAWTTSSSGGAEPALTCASNHPDLSGVVETGAASSDTFQGGARGPFVAGSTWVYKTSVQAGKVWERAVGKRLLDCLAGSVTAASSKAVKLTVKSKQVLRAPRPGSQRAAFRVVATAETSGSSQPAYYDLVVFGGGRGVAEITFARAGTPPAQGMESALAAKVARRLAAT